MGLYSDILAPIAALQGLQGTTPPAGATQTVREAIQGLTTIPESARDIRVYAMRPGGQPELPAIWNWFPDGQHELIATHLGEERLTINVRIGIRHTDADQQGLLLAAYADAFIDVFDPFLYDHADSLGALVQEATRGGMRTRPDEFGPREQGIPVLVAEFPLYVRVRRAISA